MKFRLIVDGKFVGKFNNYERAAEFAAMNTVAKQKIEIVATKA